VSPPYHAPILPGERRTVIEADGTLELLRALGDGTEGPQLEALLATSELKLMFPAVGIPPSYGLKYLEAVGRPESRGGLDEPGRQVVSYFEALFEGRARFSTLLDELRSREPELISGAFEGTRQFLPEGGSLGRPRLVFLPIGLDFRTDRETVYMDPLAALLYGPEGVQTTLSHEFHHIARYRLTGENLTLMRPHETHAPTTLPALAREWASWLEAEGIADCVSNVTQGDVPALREVAERRRQQMAGYGGLLEEGQTRFRRRDVRTPLERSDGEMLRKALLEVAHPIGARVAGGIVDGLGHRALVECVGRPDLFLRRYNSLATSRRWAAFDDALVDWLKRE
jgi:hypothetical protein